MTETTRLTAPGEARRGPATGLRTAWIWQLLFAAVVVIIVVIGYLLDPAVIVIPSFALGVAGVLLTTIASLVVPWHRVPVPVITALPYLDILWVGLMTFQTELRLSHLWVFPVTWLASQFRFSRLVVGLALVGTITLLEVLANDPSRASALRVVITVVALTFVGVAVHMTARQGRAVRTLLVRQTGRVRHSLDAVSIERSRVSDMLDAVHIGIAQVSGAGELLSFNAAYRELYSIDRDRTARSVEYDGLRGTAVRASARTYVRAARGEELVDVRVWLFSPDGAWRALSVTTRRQEPRRGEDPSTMLLVEELTSVMAADRRREALAALISHELRNPLTAILGYTDRLLENTDLDERSLRQLHIIEESGARMMHLVDEILSSPPDGVTRADRDARAIIDFTTIVEASLEAFAVMAEDRGVALVSESSDHAPLWADAFRLRHLVDNLVGNAIKYTPRGGTVSVTAERIDDDVVLTVTDTGIGIEPADLEQVFEPYFRSAAATESDVPGTGLGLGIVRMIAEAHGGTVEITSAPRAGTTVAVRIPVEAA